MRAVLGPGDVPVHPEPPVQPPDLAAPDSLGHEWLHPGPEHPAELLVRDPVEVMRQHAVLRGGGNTIPAGPHRRVGREPDSLGGAHDPPALVRGEHVAQEMQIRHGRVRVVCCYWGVRGRGSGQGDGAVVRRPYCCWVLVRRVALWPRDGLDHAELRPCALRHRRR